ncbi:MAG: SCO family protein [Rickettsiaceae bacterium H1]|nr:SCO family protein [Rickettsiaceae bacterium H1]
MRFTSSIISIIILLIFVIFFGSDYINNLNKNQTKTSEIIGGKFVLRNQEGKEISNKDLFGKYTMIFFGFSRCPHICPTQLGIISQILEEINSKKLQAFFITIDPSYDNIERLKEFHEKFDERIQMLTGSKEEIKQITDQYKVYVSSSENPEETNHSTIVYVMGKDGKYMEHLNLSNDEFNKTVKHIKNNYQGLNIN